LKQLIFVFLLGTYIIFLCSIAALVTVLQSDVIQLLMQSLNTWSDLLWGPPSLLSSGYQGLFRRGAKRQGCEAFYSPPSSAEVKKVGSIPLPPPYVFMT
jgi:hypothetical protein